MGDINSGFTPENIADAEWLWSNINADHRRFHDLPTHHKAMICHTAQRFRADRITQQEAVIAGLVEALEGLMAHEPDYSDTLWENAAEALAKAKESRDD